MRLSSALAGALSLATLALASSDVVDLTAKSFDKEVTNDSGLTLVEFFAPWWCVPLPADRSDLLTHAY
jgi:hypothetical protein